MTKHQFEVCAKRLHGIDPAAAERFVELVEKAADLRGEAAEAQSEAWDVYHEHLPRGRMREIEQRAGDR